MQEYSKLLFKRRMASGRWHMIKIVFLFVFSFNIYAQEFSMKMDYPNLGELFYRIELSGEKVFVTKNNNLFDKKKVLGKFVESKKNKSIHKKMERLSELLMAINKSMNLIGSDKSQLNDGSFKHTPFYQLGKFEIKASHPYFKEVSEIFEEIISKISISPLNAIVVTKNRTSLFINGTVKENKSFSPVKNCDSYNDDICFMMAYGYLKL